MVHEINMRSMLAAVLILLAQPASAAGPGDLSVSLHYEAYSHGLAVMRLDADLRLSRSGYGVSASYRTVGLAHLLYNGHENDAVSGAWDGGGTVPAQYLATGTWREHQRETELVYRNSMPEIRIAVPPVADERQSVPADRLPGTIDTLSALVDLMHHVEASGNCELSVRTFDGRRLSEIAAQTAGLTTLQPTDRSDFAGPALRCDFTGRMLAGFMLDRPRDKPVHPYHGSAWLAHIVPGAPPVPVRLSFETGWVGEVTMYLVGYNVEPVPAVQANSTAER